MNAAVAAARDFLVSLKLTLGLLALAVVLIFVATLDQVNLGVWAVQQKYFRSFVVYTRLGAFTIPVLPGGYAIGGLLLANLVAAHLYRFSLAWRKAGLLLTHFGLILLLVGELLSGIWQRDYHLRLNEGETKNYAESFRDNELVLIDQTDATFDDVVAIPETLLERKVTVQHPRLPFRVIPKTYYPNSVLQIRPDPGPPSLATAGVGERVLAAPQPVTFKIDERNDPTAFVELVGSDGSLGVYLVSTALAVPQTFTHAGRTWRIALRPQRAYQRFALTLLNFSHDRYPGTDIPKNFSSRVRLTSPEGREDHEVVISMNHPLRHGGMTFYQAGFANNDRTTVLQVVHNPSWRLPYVACGLMAAGLVLQFGLHLGGFVRRRPTALATRGGPGLDALAPAASAARWRWVIPVIVGTALFGAAFTLRPLRNSGAFDVVGFGRLPTLVNGRIKPFDTVARTSLLVLQGRQRVITAEGTTLSPTEWLLDVLFRPERADTYQVFQIVHPDLVTLFAVNAADGAGGKRFSLRQLRPRLADLESQARLADQVENADRSTFQRATIQLRDAVMLYQRLQNTLAVADNPELLARLAADSAPPAWRTLDGAFAVMENFAYFRPIPPANPKVHPDDWQSAGAAWRATAAGGDIVPTARTVAALGHAWRGQNSVAFNQALALLTPQFEQAAPTAVKKSALEQRFNAAAPFTTSLVLYSLAFLAGLASWLRWREFLSRTAFALLAVAFAVATAGILARMWLESRPPVTNLYSSALFVGWAAVGLCLVLESIYRNATASVAAGGIGFATLLIAHHLALGGDTLEMMRAVLDSNFWLATHVVTVTVGYSATFLAGLLALIFVLRGLFTRSLSTAEAGALTRMTYGVVCFATLFSFVGTVLGGIWADQSWGRFWGWDPKENGALLIVSWNAIILHARWDGFVRPRGLAMLAIGGNVVTAWSWFGVNMLGVGLHSYGFMDSAFWWLIGFAGSQLALILAAATPLPKWRSFKDSPPAPHVLRVASAAPATAIT